MRLTGCDSQRSWESGSARSAVRSEVRSVRDSSSLKLTLKTAEGDTVEISLDAQSLRQSERSSAREPGGRIRSSADQQSSSLTASVNVIGELNSDEVEDIKGLLQTLANGSAQPVPQDLDTISAYQYTYQRTHEVRQSQVEAYG